MNAVMWGIVTGCERLSPGCANCPSYWEYKDKGLDYHPVFHADRLRDLVDADDGTIAVVAPGSDLFHEAVRAEWIRKAVDVMRQTPNVIYEMATKRVERLAAMDIEWPDNVRVCVAVEESKYKWRVDMLRNDVRAKNKMVSFGPMTGRIGQVTLEGIDVAGVIVETWGPDPRAVKDEWVEEIRMQCEEQGVQYSTDSWIYKEVQV
jgi:protein gp37